MNNFKITDLLDELKQDPSWCEDDAKRAKLVKLLTNILLNT